MTTVAASPATWEQGSEENLPLSVSFAASLGAVTIVSATVRLINTRSGLAYAAGLGAVGITATTITQWVTSLRPGELYRLVVTVTDSSAREWSTWVDINCPY